MRLISRTRLRWCGTRTTRRESRGESSLSEFAAGAGHSLAPRPSNCRSKSSSSYSSPRAGGQVRWAFANGRAAHMFRWSYPCPHPHATEGWRAVSSPSPQPSLRRCCSAINCLIDLLPPSLLHFSTVSHHSHRSSTPIPPSSPSRPRLPLLLVYLQLGSPQLSGRFANVSPNTLPGTCSGRKGTTPTPPRLVAVPTGTDFF